MRPAQPSAESEVGEFDVTVLVDQDVIRLDVSVDEAQRMHVLDGTRQLGNVESELSHIRDNLWTEWVPYTELNNQINQPINKHSVYSRR